VAADALDWYGRAGCGGRAIRVSTPVLFVSIGGRRTERRGRIRLGLEGILVQRFSRSLFPERAR
jgi:hypothetical protein